MTDNHAWLSVCTFGPKFLHTTVPARFLCDTSSSMDTYRASYEGSYVTPVSITAIIRLSIIFFCCPHILFYTYTIFYTLPVLLTRSQRYLHFWACTMRQKVAVEASIESVCNLQKLRQSSHFIA